MFYAKLILNDPDYRGSYKAVFGKTPKLTTARGSPTCTGLSKPRKIKRSGQAWRRATNSPLTEVFANLGKALAAYQRMLKPGASRFDDYVKSLNSNQRILPQTF